MRRLLALALGLALWWSPARADSIFAAPIDTTAWTNFTPTLTCGTAVFTTTAARSKTLGKSTFIMIDFTITSIGSCTTVATFTLPNTANSGGAIVGREIASSAVVDVCAVAAASATATCAKSALGAFLVNDHYVMSGVYENQ